MQTDKQLPRVLGPWMATAIVVGCVIGSGVFKKANKVSEALPEVGLAMAAWVLVGFITMVGALALAEVAIVYPKAGGNYVFLREGYGRLAGFLWGWVEFWFIRSASIAALAWVFAECLIDLSNTFLVDWGMAGLNEYVQYGISKYVITIAVILALAALNIRGTLLGGRVQLLLTWIKVLSLVGIIVLPFLFWILGSAGDHAPSTARLRPLFPDHWSSSLFSQFGAAMIAIFWAYDGWMNIAPIAGEVDNPSRNLPRAVIAGVMALIFLYVSVNLSYYLTIPATEIAGLKGRTTAAEFAYRLLGPAGLLVATGCLMVSVFGALNGNVLVGPRLLYAMGEDALVPIKLHRIHPRYQTPDAAIAVVSLFSVILVVAGGLLMDNPDDFFDKMTDFSMFGALLFGALAVGSLFVVRRKFPVATVKLPYRCPLYPVTPILYIVFALFVVGNMCVSQPKESLIGAGLMALGAVVYAVLYRRPKTGVKE